MEWDVSIMDQHFADNDIWLSKSEFQKKTSVAVASRILENNYRLNEEDSVHLIAVATQALFMMQGQASDLKENKVISASVKAMLANTEEQETIAYL